MKIRVTDGDPSKLVVYTEDVCDISLDKAAKIAKDIADGFSGLASVALDTSIKEFPVDRLADVTKKMSMLKGMNLQLQVPRELLGILSSATPPSEFFGRLSSEINSEEHALCAKKKLFSAFLRHLDSSSNEVGTSAQKI